MPFARFYGTDHQEAWLLRQTCQQLPCIIGQTCRRQAVVNIGPQVEAFYTWLVACALVHIVSKPLLQFIRNCTRYANQATGDHADFLQPVVEQLSIRRHPPVRSVEQQQVVHDITDLYAHLPHLTVQRIELTGQVHVQVQRQIDVVLGEVDNCVCRFGKLIINAGGKGISIIILAIRKVDRTNSQTCWLVIQELVEQTAYDALNT